MSDKGFGFGIIPAVIVLVVLVGLVIMVLIIGGVI